MPHLHLGYFPCISFDTTKFFMEMQEKLYVVYCDGPFCLSETSSKVQIISFHSLINFAKFLLIHFIYRSPLVAESIDQDIEFTRTQATVVGGAIQLFLRALFTKILKFGDFGRGLF